MQDVRRGEDRGFVPITIGVSLLFSVIALYIGIYLSESILGMLYGVNMRQIVPAYMALTFISLRFTNAYSIGRRRLFELEYAVFVSAIITNTFMLMLPFFDIVYDLPITAVLLTAVMQFALLTAWVMAFHRLYYSVTVRRTAVVVADTALRAVYCADKVKGFSLEYEVLGAVCVDDAAFMPQCDAVIAYGLDAAAQERLFVFCEQRGMTLCVTPSIYQIGIRGGRDVQFGDIIALRVGAPGLSNEQALVKRIFDIVLSLMALAITLVPIFLLALAIFAYDRRNPFFVQQRLTRGWRTFGCIKLRTMVSDAEADTGPVLAAENDPRITPIGALLRRTRLDELPQFLNVLKGDMSIVGPRPERAWFVEEYMKEVPDFGRRLTVKAGITGFAHVYGRYDTPPAERINLDMYYIRNYSIRLDIKILIETARIMCSRSYAEGVKGRRPS